MTAAISKALIVDDSRMARATLSKLLQKRGIAVDSAESGMASLEYMANHEAPDIVFMDYTMPDIDGFEAIRRIREHHGDVAPMAMYTGQDSAEDRERARQLGIEAFLSKPASDDRIDDVLAQVAEAAAAKTESEGQAANAEHPATTAAPQSGSAEASAAAAPGDAEHERPTAAEAPAAASATATGTADESALRRESVAAAEEAARAVAEETASSLAEQRAREMADAAVRDATETIAAAVSPAAAKQAAGEVRQDLANQVDEIMQSDEFAQRLAKVFLGLAWPKARARVVSEVTDSLRDKIDQIAREAAEDVINQRVGDGKPITKPTLDERTAALRSELYEAQSRGLNESEARLRRLIMAVGAGLGASMVVGFGLVLLLG